MEKLYFFFTLVSFIILDNILHIKLFVCLRFSTNFLQDNLFCPSVVQVYDYASYKYVLSIS